MPNGTTTRQARPATLTARDGSALFEFRDGMWRGPEMTDEAKAARFGDAA